MKKKFDILVTVYNKENHLNRCLDSIANQTYENYNVIVVDDGSTDSSANIIKQYSEKYPNILYYYKENTGVADTRNFAISKVESDYFLFVDADDYISLNLLKEVSTYVNKNTDIVSFSCLIINNTLVKNFISKKGNFHDIPGKEAIKLYNIFSKYKNVALYDVPWGYIYRTEFFRKNNFKYLYGTEHEDCSLTPMIITKADKVTSLNYVGYYYVQNLDSITHNDKTSKKRIVDKLNHLKQLSLFLQQQDFDSVTMEAIRTSVLYKILGIVLENDIKHIKFYMKQIKKLKIYEVIPNNSKTSKMYRLLFKEAPLLLILFNLVYLYRGNYNMFPMNISNFLFEMREYGAKKYTAIMTNTDRSYYLMRIKRSVLFYSNIIFHLPVLLNKKYIRLDLLQLDITTKCNLKCKNCSGLSPFYSKNCRNIPFKDIEVQIDELLKVVNEINVIEISGGEPFLHEQLHLIIEKLSKSKQISKIHVITNGTILLKEEDNMNLLDALKCSKVCVYINNYNVNSNSTSALAKLLKSKCINTNILKDDYWLNYGDFNNQNKDETKLIKQFNQCTSDKRILNYFNGKIHICARSSHMMDLGIIENNPNEYVDLITKNSTYSNKKSKLINLLNKTKYISACNYCNIATECANDIDIAEQTQSD